MHQIFSIKKIAAISYISSIDLIQACRNLGNGGHNSISHPHAQFPKHYNLEDVLVSSYCYRNYNASCPTCHTHGLLEYSCSFCIENTCEQESCGKKWGWLNQLEECRQTIIATETINTNLDRLQLQFDQLISGNGPNQSIQDFSVLQQKLASQEMLTNSKIQDRNLIFDSENLPGNVQTFIHQQQQPLGQQIANNEQNIQEPLSSSELLQDTIEIESNNSTIIEPVDDEEEHQSQEIIIGDEIDELEVPNSTNSKLVEALTIEDNKYPPLNLDYRIYCADPTAELNKATLRCYAQCPPNYNRFGVSCFSNCATPQKDEFSTYCIEPEVRKPIELFSSCAEDCNENNIHDFCFACPEGMHKKDCQCVKSEKIEFREILERSYTNAIMLLID